MHFLDAVLLPVFQLLLIWVRLLALAAEDARNVEVTVQADQRRWTESEAAAQALKAFMRYTFHELRVPLHTVVLGTEMLKQQLQRGDDTANDGEILESMEASADAMVGPLLYHRTCTARALVSFFT